MPKRWLIFVVTAFMVGGGCALQDDLVTVNNRLVALKQRVSRLDKSTEALRAEISRSREEETKSDQAHRTRDADLRAFMNDLRSEMQELRGQVEEGQYHTRRLSEIASRDKESWDNLEKSLQNNIDRIVRLEQYLGMEPSEKLLSTGPTKVKPNDEKTLAKRTPDELYVAAKQQFDRGEYESAREQFQTFLSRHPKSKNADNARFWIGEVYFREKWYEKAILEYQKVIEDYPKGNKLRSALLKQGFAFLNLGDKDNARLILKELVRKYPRSKEAEIAREKLERSE